MNFQVPHPSTLSVKGAILKEFHSPHTKSPELGGWLLLRGFRRAEDLVFLFSACDPVDWAR
jgi:hypothetical protein